MTGFIINQKREILERQHLKCRCGRTVTLTAKTLREWKKELGHYPDISVPSQAKFHHKIFRCGGGSNETSNGEAVCGRCHALIHPQISKYRKLKTSV